MRVKAAIWVQAFVRRVNASGDAFAVVARHGADDAGAILIRIDRLDGSGNLYVPAPQTAYGEDAPSERFWIARFPDGPAPNDKIDEVITRELRIDPDIWVVAIDDRAGRHFLEASLAR